MAKMKVWTEGRHLWTRTIGSTAVGQLVDSTLFYPIAFSGTWQPGTMMKVVAFNWAFKLSVEILFTPLTYARPMAQAPGERGLVRQADELHPVFAEGLSRRSIRRLGCAIPLKSDGGQTKYPTPYLRAISTFAQRGTRLNDLLGYRWRNSITAFGALSQRTGCMPPAQPLT